MDHKKKIKAAHYYYSSQGGETPVTAYLGTLGDPVSGGSTLNKTTTWVMPQSKSCAGVAKNAKVYCTATGNIIIKVLQPSVGGFDVTYSQQFSVGSIGLSAIALPDVPIPPNSLIGFHTPSSGGATLSYTSDSTAYNIGYLAGAGNLTGNGVVLNTVSYRDLIQAQVEVEYSREDYAEYFINETFGGTTLPAFGVNNTGSAWTFAAGYMQNAGTGLANFFDFLPSLNIDRQTLEVDFIFQGSGNRISIGKKPILGGGGVDAGTVCELDLDNNRSIIYQTWSGGTTLPSSRDTLTLTNLTLATAKKFTLQLKKTGRVNTVKAIDTTNLAEQTLTNDSGSGALSGQNFGRPSISILAGTVRVTAVRFFPDVPNPKILIVGDSNVEGSGTTDALCYPQLVLDAVGGRGWYDGDGGTISTNCLRRLRQDLRFCAPQFVVIDIGANNANSDIDTAQFNTDIDNIYAEIVNAGATPVICTLTPNSNATVNARCQTMNAYLLGKGWRLCRFDLAVSENNDGSTWDGDFMADGVHRNAAGQALCFARLQTDFPEMF